MVLKPIYRWKFWFRFRDRNEVFMYLVQCFGPIMSNFLGQFLIARLARSDPRNHFVVNFLCAILSNFRVFRHY